MKNFFAVVTVSMILSIALAGCVHGQDIPVNKEPQLVNVDFDSVFSYKALLDDSYVYLSADASSVSYNRAYFTGETVLLGQVSNFYLSMRHSVLNYPELFMFISKFSDDMQTSENYLISLNLSDQTITEYKNDDGSIPGIPTYGFDGGILTLKEIDDSESATTFIEKVDLEGENWKKILTCTFDITTQSGEAIQGLCSDNDNLYVIYNVYSGEENIETFLKWYDKSLNELKSIQISDDIRDYVLTSSISNMQVFDDYIYLYNTSNDGFLGRVDDDEINEIFRGENFELSLDHTSLNPLFYTRNTHSVYTLEDGKLTEYKIETGEGYSIRTMLSNDETAFINFHSDDSREFAYLVNREYLEGAVFPCK